MQQSKGGLFRTLTYQLLSQHPEETAHIQARWQIHDHKMSMMKMRQDAADAGARRRPSRYIGKLGAVFRPPVLSPERLPLPDN